MSRAPSLRSWNGWFWGLVGTVAAIEIALLWLGMTLVSRTLPCFWAGAELFGWDAARLSCTGAGAAGTLTYVVPVVVTTVVFASLLAGIAVSVRTVVKTRRRVGPVLARSQPARELLLEIIDRLDPGDPPEVLEVDLDEPVCFVHGLLDPAIVISTGLVDELDEQQLRAVLAHELRHVRVRDPLKVVAARALSAAAFPFPVLRDLVDHVLLRSELNADETAAASAGRHTIAETLTRVLFHPRYAVDTAFGAPETARARVARLAGHDPPGLDLSPTRLAVSAASLLAIVGATTAVLVVLPTPPPAYATGDTAPASDLGWTDVPTPTSALPQDFERRLHAACDPSYRMIADLPRPDGFGPDFPEGPLALAVADNRGQITVAVFAAHPHLFVCHVDRFEPEWQVVGASADVVSGETDGPLTALLRYTSTTRDGIVTSVSGTASPDVDEVVVRLTDGSDVIAELDGGHYAAWWPTATEPAAVIGRAAGRVIAEIPPPDMSAGS